jgi:hypothetical protein
MMEFDPPLSPPETTVKIRLCFPSRFALLIRDFQFDKEGDVSYFIEEPYYYPQITTGGDGFPIELRSRVRMTRGKGGVPCHFLHLTHPFFVAFEIFG